MATLKCFVIMPFKAGFDAVFEEVRRSARSAVPENVIECSWLKDIHAAGRITDDILDGLHKCTLCIGDVTGNNPNVMWETGYAMALGKPMILIGQRVEELPFDLKVQRVLAYSPDDVSSLGSRLAESIRQTLSKHAFKPQFQQPDQTYHDTPVIAVTGTQVTDPALTRQRIEDLLLPYLRLNAAWFCGSSGTTDEMVLEFLVANKQRAVAVGYHRYDPSASVRKLVEDSKIAFLDAALQALPRKLTGPSQRDILFCARSQLVVLFWDGQSKGTGELLQYFQENSKNLLIGYV